MFLLTILIISNKIVLVVCQQMRDIFEMISLVEFETEIETGLSRQDVEIIDSKNGLFIYI